MIIKRKYFTRQEAKAVKEIYNALKKGNVGRDLSANDFVRVRHMSNETIDALTSNGKVADFAKNEEIIKKLGLPETSKAYKGMVEKYSNPELYNRFKKIQQASSNSRLKQIRKYKRLLENEINSFGDKNSERKNILIKEYDKTLNILQDIKNRRGSNKNYKFNKNKLEQEFNKEYNDLKNSKEYFKNLANEKEVDSEMSQKIIKDLKKKNVKFINNPNFETHYSKSTGEISLKTKNDRKSPSTVLHEFGHKLSFDRKETRPQHYKPHNNLLDKVNTSDNLRQSIENRLSDLSRLTEEANASYHAIARSKKYEPTKERMKASRKSLDDSFRTYELGSATRLLKDNFKIELGKRRNK